MIRIIDSPSGSALARLSGHLMLHVKSPRTQTSVTICVSSIPLFRQQSSGVPESQPAYPVAPSQPHQTCDVLFDVSGATSHTVRLDGVQYTICLLQIGEVAEGAIMWPWYDVQVTQRAN